MRHTTLLAKTIRLQREASTAHPMSPKARNANGEINRALQTYCRITREWIHDVKPYAARISKAARG